MRVMADNYYDMVRDQLLDNQLGEPDRITWEWRKLTLRERLRVLFGADDPRVTFHWDDKKIALFDEGSEVANVDSFGVTWGYIGHRRVR